MSITANKNNGLQVLSAVSANVGGTLRSLQQIHANVNGELRKLFSAGGETTTEAEITLTGGARLSNNWISASSSYTNGVASTKITAGSGGAGTSDATGAYASGGFHIENANGDRVILT